MKPQNPKYCIAFLALILLLAITGCQPGSKEQVYTTTQPAVTSPPTSTFTGNLSYNEALSDARLDDELFYSWLEEGLHWRMIAGYWDGNFSDDRLDGEYLMVTNWDSDKNITDENWLMGNASGILLGVGGTEEQESVSDNGPVRWDGAYTGVTEEDLIGHSDFTLHGVGQNKGLTAKMTCEIQYIVEPLSMGDYECQGAMYAEE